MPPSEIVFYALEAVRKMKRGGLLRAVCQEISANSRENAPVAQRIEQRFLEPWGCRWAVGLVGDFECLVELVAGGGVEELGIVEVSRLSSGRPERVGLPSRGWPVCVASCGRCLRLCVWVRWSQWRRWSDSLRCRFVT